MNIKVSAKGSRIAAGLILTLLVGLVTTATVLPIWSLNHGYTEKISSMQARLEILRRSAAIGVALESQFQRLKLRQASDIRYLKSPSEALAAAELQRVVKKISVREKGQVLSTQIVTAKQEQGFTRVTLRVRMKGSLESLVAVFYALETGNPYLFLDDVSLRGRAVVRRRSAAIKKAGASRQRLLDAEFSLSAYIRSSAV